MTYSGQPVVKVSLSAPCSMTIVYPIWALTLSRVVKCTQFSTPLRTRSSSPATCSITSSTLSSSRLARMFLRVESMAKALTCHATMSTRTCTSYSIEPGLLSAHLTMCVTSALSRTSHSACSCSQKVKHLSWSSDCLCSRATTRFTMIPKADWASFLTQARPRMVLTSPRAYRQSICVMQRSA